MVPTRSRGPPIWPLLAFVSGGDSAPVATPCPRSRGRRTDGIGQLPVTSSLPLRSRVAMSA